MKRAASLLMLTALLLSAAISAAVPPGKFLEFRDGAQGKVVFNGTTHSEAGYWCSNCHTEIFSINPSERIKITLEDHVPGRLCGVCHDGTKAFSVDDKKNCGRCHVRK
jgi:c(7)-type cytochrome triheme protein